MCNDSQIKIERFYKSLYNNCNTCYYFGKENEMKIIFVSGMFAGGWVWEKVLPNLREKNTYLQELPLAMIGGDIRDICKSLQQTIDESDMGCIIIGNSLGGLISILLALDNPKKVRGIVISGAPGMGSTNLGIGLSMSDEWFESLKEQLFVDPKIVTDQQIREVKKCFKDRTYLKSIVRLSRYSNRIDVKELLDKVECPMKMIWGKEDKVSATEPWKEYARTNSLCTMKILDNCGHSPMIEKPLKFTECINSFIEEVKHE